MRSVVLTGVSRGLGAALFDQLTARGDRVLGIGRHFTDAQRRLAAAHPDRVRLHRADLSDPGQVPTAKELADFLNGGAAAGESVLLLNAGVVEPIGAVGTLDPAAVAAAVAVNLTAPVLLANAFRDACPGPAAVLYVSSGAAHHPIRGWAVYCATKRGAELFFETLAQEAPPVRVACVNPGVMDTGMQTAIRAAGDFPDRARFVGLHEHGQLPDPAHVAREIIATHLPW
jgi:NAD(P)-dependent dehydrogenase (short-subunit alcohol dehydrogenase family)